MRTKYCRSFRLGKVLILFWGELVKVGVNLLYLLGRTGRGGGELVGGELVMGRNLRNSQYRPIDVSVDTRSILEQHFVLASVDTSVKY